MATAAQWWAGARPRTLPAALAPVAAGTGAAAAIDAAVGWKALLCLVVALALQIGVNYANDYSDGVRGTDADRIGPARLVGSGAASPAAVKRAAFVAFGVAAVAGLVLAATSGWWLLAVGAVAIGSAWFYTGGPRPYGYAGLGEAFVFVFFGLVAVGGTSYVQAGRVTETGWVAAIGCGLLSVAILLANNLRDIPTDAVSGKRTLAVRLGDRRTRQAYLAAVSLALLLPLGMPFTGQPAALLALAGAWPAWRAVSAVRSGAAGPALIPVLVGTGQALLLYGLGFGIGLALGG